MSLAIVCMVSENKTMGELSGNVSINKCGKEVVASSDSVIGEFDWDKATQGRVLGAFFYGYIGSQILGGIIASKFGGKRIIFACILGSSLFTLLSPIAARTSSYFLVILRALIGFLQGATFPAMHTMWSVWGPPLELSVLTGITYAGSQVGNVVVLPLAGYLCQNGFDGGWPSIFYILGFAGVFWCAAWMYMTSDRPATHPRISAEEKNYIIESIEASTGKGHDKPPPTPWKSIFTSRAVWACWIGHFAGDWGAYTMMVAMPMFLKDVLQLDLSSLGVLASVPYVAYFLAINVGGILADTIRSKGILGTLNTRRGAMLTALIGQAIFLVLSSYCGCGQEILVIVFLTIGMAISGLQYSGFVVNYLDIAPIYSGTIMGIGNTISCLAGVLTPEVTTFLVRNNSQEEWQLVMWVTAGVLVTGSVIFSLFAKGEVQEWAKNKSADSVEGIPLKEKTPEA
ncbi:unnamed protein product [Auanema sp. JU1783]|nr:unnamed protein product [Auanema sp. JU1783]